jgi:hypothetical protein
VDFEVSVYRVPQVPGNEFLKIYETGDGRRFVGNDWKKDFLEYVRAMIAKHPDAVLVGNAVEMIKPVKEVVQI